MPTETIPGSERRLFERFSARLPAKFKDSRFDFGSNVSLRDASAQGVRLISRERLFIHDSVSIEVKLPESDQVMTLRGEVVWAKRIENSFWDIGIQFYKIDLLSLSRLYQSSQV
jgi:hypothetical protein